MRWSLSLILTFLSVQSVAQARTDEQKAIINVIQTAYVEGLQNEGDTIKIDQGFHPAFRMIGLGDDGQMWEYPIEKWREAKIENRKKGLLPRPKETEVSLEFVFIDVSDEVAVAKVFYLEGGKHTYTDYISLYRFADGWKIVPKIFDKE